MTGVSGLCHKTMNNTRPKWQNPDTTPPQKGRHLAETWQKHDSTRTWLHKTDTQQQTRQEKSKHKDKGEGGRGAKPVPAGKPSKSRKGREGWAREAQAGQGPWQGARAEPEGRTSEDPAEQEPW